jgi:hypothetical protein
MNYSYLIGIFFVLTFLGFIQVADTDPQTASSMIHIDKKVRGVVANLACEPLPEARMTFRNKQQIQIITPDQNGQFQVDLPPGNYQVIVELPSDSSHRIASRKLEVSHNKKGEPCVWLNTGVEATHCYCFESNNWDQFFPLPPIN